MYVSGVRDLKEQLFLTGSLTYELSNDRIVWITLDEFLNTPGVKAFSENVTRKLRDFLEMVDDS